LTPSAQPLLAAHARAAVGSMLPHFACACVLLLVMLQDARQLPDRIHEAQAPRHLQGLQARPDGPLRKGQV